MKNFKYLFPLLSLIFIFGVSALATYGLSDNLQSASNLREASLQTRASKIFSLDAHKKISLPQNQLVALSVALKFKDIDGAEKLVERLEQRIQN